MKLASFLSVLLIAGCASAAHADSFTVSYLAAGTQASTSSTYVENFNTGTVAGNGSYTTTFNGSNLTGTYTGSYGLNNADQYGGANGTGKYITTTGAGGSYSLALSGNVNYFGLWFSALDAGNQLSFYSGDTLLYSFTSASFINGVGACPGSAYCGNPNSGADSGEQFAFIHFYDTNGTFNKIVFSEAVNSGQFESDNHTVASLATAPGGTVLTPEPSSLALLGTGMLGLVGTLRRRIFTVRG